MAINIIEYNRSYKEELIEFILSIQKNEFNIKIDRDDQPDLENIEHNYLNSGGNLACNKQSSKYCWYYRFD